MSRKIPQYTLNLDNMSTRKKIEPCLEDTSLCHFGQYKGRPMQDIPASYLLWCWEQDWLPTKYPLVYAYINNSLDALKEECPDWIENKRR